MVGSCRVISSLLASYNFIRKVIPFSCKANDITCSLRTKAATSQLLPAPIGPQNTILCCFSLDLKALCFFIVQPFEQYAVG